MEHKSTYRQFNVTERYSSGWIPGSEVRNWISSMESTVVAQFRSRYIDDCDIEVDYIEVDSDYIDEPIVKYALKLSATLKDCIDEGIISVPLNQSELLRNYLLKPNSELLGRFKWGSDGANEFERFMGLIRGITNSPGESINTK